MSQEVLTFRAVVEIGHQWTSIAALISAKSVDNHPKNRFYGGVRRVQRALGIDANAATDLLAEWARISAPVFESAGDGSSAIERFEHAQPDRRVSFEDPIIAMVSEASDDSQDAKDLRAMLPSTLAGRVRAHVAFSAAHPRRSSTSSRRSSEVAVDEESPTAGGRAASRRSSASEFAAEEDSQTAGGRAATTPPPRVRTVSATSASASRSSTRSGARAPHPSAASASADDALVPLALSMTADGVLTAATERGQSIVEGLAAFASKSGFPSIVYFVPQTVLNAAAESAANEAAAVEISPDFSPPPDEETATALLTLRSSTPRDAAESDEQT